MNMLSAKKVRLHGMQSSRWTTRDKLTQYKGLINLFTRDRKISTFDNIVTRKKQVKELKQLRRDIKSHRSELDNAIQGDRQTLRNTLAEHKDLQLAFQNLHPDKVINHLHQANFNKRKSLDRMQFRMKQKTEMLISLKLEFAQLEDRMKYENFDQFPIELEAQFITAKVQDAILKKEAALAVGQTYSNILKILQKDSIYFDAVLETLKLDGFLQGKCMVRATELGQLATEYLDDRKQEFKELEKAVKRDMKARLVSLQIVRQEVQDLNSNMGMLIRKDSDINIGKVILPETHSDITLLDDMEWISNMLQFLQDTTFVSTFEQIQPCLIEQQRQKVRLRELLDKCTEDRNNLFEKYQHADLMYSTLLYTMNATTFEYKKKKAEFLEETENANKTRNEVRQVDLNQGALLVSVRSSVHQLAQKCLIVKGSEDAKIKAPAKIGIKITEHIKRSDSRSSFILPPPRFEEDCTVCSRGFEILSLLEKKLTQLMSNALPSLSESGMDEAYKHFYQLTSGTCAAIQYEEAVVDDSLITDIVIEDSQVPNYNDIKAKSKELVDISTVDQDLVPMFTPKKKLKLK